MRSLRASVVVVALAAPQIALADEGRTFGGVSAEVFACVRTTSAAEQGTVYIDAADGHGTATTSSTLWSVVMEYAFSADRNELQYWLVRKSWIVPADAIWSGIAAAIDACRDAA